MPRCCSDTQFFPIKEENETHVEIDVNSKYDTQELFDSIWQKLTKTRDMSGRNNVIFDFLDIQITVVKHKKALKLCTKRYQNNRRHIYWLQ